MSKLSQMSCVALSANDRALGDDEIESMHQEVPQWQIKTVDGIRRLERVFTCKNFTEALALTNKIGAIAEEQNHHPLIVTEWGKVTLNWWTHKVGGLHKNDFIMAAKSDEIAEQ
jgi:4a-hydroxytetrahydrobiopterin dehydratase